jgi:hypothetical protein
MVGTLAERLRALLGEVERTTPRLANAMRLEPVGKAESAPDEHPQARDPFIISRAARVKHERARGSHQDTLMQLAHLLSSAGFVPQENQYIDLYTHLRSDHGIFEIKSISDTNERSQIRAALSQLYEYPCLRFWRSRRPSNGPGPLVLVRRQPAAAFEGAPSSGRRTCRLRARAPARRGRPRDIR